jgi:Ribosomal proteins 50S-L15, 50S-L18e, 60S-L27A
VNVGALAVFAAGSQVDGEALQAVRLVRTGRPVKILGQGDLSVKLTVEAASFSKSAKSKIEAAGGTVVWLNGEPPAADTEAAPKEPKKRRASKAAAANDAEAKADAAEAETPAQGEASDGAGS